MDDDRSVDSGRPTDQDEPRVFKVATPGGRRAVLEALTRGAVAGAAVVAAGTCGDDNPAGPTSTTTTVSLVHALTGVVTNASTAAPCSGARVTVLDGVNAGQSAVTDGNGAYSLPALSQGGFTAQATCAGYNSLAKGVTLIRDMRVDFALVLIPTTTTSRRTTTTTGCSCNSQGCSCNHNVCSCNPLTYWYPN